MGHARSHTEFGPYGFRSFDVLWIQTRQANRQTDKQSIYIERWNNPLKSVQWIIGSDAHFKIAQCILYIVLTTRGLKNI